LRRRRRRRLTGTIRIQVAREGGTVGQEDREKPSREAPKTRQPKATLGCSACP